MRRRFRSASGGLLPHLFTLASGGPAAVFFLLHWPSRGLLSAVSFFSKGLPALRSPDFPRPAFQPDAIACKLTHPYQII